MLWAEGDEKAVEECKVDSQFRPTNMVQENLINSYKKWTLYILKLQNILILCPQRYQVYSFVQNLLLAQTLPELNEGQMDAEYSLNGDQYFIPAVRCTEVNYNGDIMSY